MIGVFSTNASAVNGKVKKLVSYSYIKGVQVYFETGHTGASSCLNSGVITIKADDPNGVNMMAMVNLAFATHKTLFCAAKQGCTGINNEEVANYCTLTH